ncbi:arylsulfatase B [Rhodopirellula sallentina]|uniref:Arylsulfatase B n=1 Tax=Rhodopirellula sallentina SM41 TaxID=1263870 RepID=M5UM39_9BACT|nr:arylsulfatase [Rhodopirellula sallentina]EMI57078.1 arylsulfatase B [Rhodopirellula sallentina SM41]
MKLQLFYYIFVVAALICVVPANADAPNIVHIIADDLGWNDVGYHGSEIKTPHLDALASESVILDRFYVTPICSPTRAGVLTGRYPFRFGIWGSVCNPLARHGLPPTEQTTSELLKLAGYQHRAVFGKWHLGLASTKFHPLRHGFTDFYGHYNGAIDYFSRKRFGQLDWHRNYESVQEEGYSTDLLGAAAVNFISERSAESPFYLLVTFNAPHSPVQAKPEDLKAYGFDPNGDRAPNTDAGIARREKFAAYGEGAKGNTVRQTFAAMTTAMDRNIGTILDALDENGFRENTLVIFHSDNGGDPKHGGNNQPLRGKKFTTWEGGVRVPAIMRWPARLKGGTKYGSVTSYIDILPTLAGAAGIANPTGIDGSNLLPYLEGRQPPPERVLLLSEDTVVTDQWKLIGGEIFDLKNNPAETGPLSDPPADVLTQLHGELARFAELEGPPTVSTAPNPTNWPPKDWKLPEEKEQPMEPSE